MSRKLLGVLDGGAHLGRVEGSGHRMIVVEPEFTDPVPDRFPGLGGDVVLAPFRQPRQLLQHRDMTFTAPLGEALLAESGLAAAG